MAEISGTERESSKESGAIYGVSVEITAVLGTSMMPISQVLKLGRGAVVELQRRVGEDIGLKANNTLVARGEINVLEDKLGVTITNMVKATLGNRKSRNQSPETA